MKLNTAQVRRTIDQLQAQAVPDDHPAASQLKRLYGDHSFFLTSKGLHIVEESGANEAQVIKLASWEDTARTSLRPHEPEATDVVVQLNPAKSDSAE